MIVLTSILSAPEDDVDFGRALAGLCPWLLRPWLLCPLQLQPHAAYSPMHQPALPCPAKGSPPLSEQWLTYCKHFLLECTVDTSHLYVRADLRFWFCECFDVCVWFLNSDCFQLKEKLFWKTLNQCTHTHTKPRNLQTFFLKNLLMD